MILAGFTQSEVTAAIARGVRQLVVIGGSMKIASDGLKLFVVNEDADGGEMLASALANSSFDERLPSEFIWLGGVGYRTVESVMTTLRFIASLPKGSGVLIDYFVERVPGASLPGTTLDALASRIADAAGDVKHLIQPQAVMALLRGLGFREVLDVPGAGNHLVSAVV